MIFGSVCSGIEAASVAWHPLGWRAAFLSEIDAAPRAVLKHHYPATPLHGDFTTIEAGDYEPIDLLVGGTPCQDFSVAGLRAGMAGDRGNLTLQFLTLARRLRPRWLVWENVPGVLSSNGGRDFGAFLGGLGELGYGWAYRTLDAQFFGVAQRRRRVFVVGYLGDWRRAAAVLFERHCLQGHPAPSREAGQGVAACLTFGAHPGSHNGQDDAKDGRLIAFSAKDYGQDAGDLAPTLRGGNHTTSHENGGVMPAIAFGWQNSAHQGDSVSSAHTPSLDKSKVPAVAFNITPSNSNKDYNARASDRAQAITSGGNRPSARGGDLIAQAFMENVRAELRVSEQTDALTRGGGKPGQGYAAAMHGSSVRRLSPRECERLQGFPDDYTAVPYRGKPMADGPRYKALGNSMAVPVMRWIGERIQTVEDFAQSLSEAA